MQPPHPPRLHLASRGKSPLRSEAARTACSATSLAPAARGQDNQPHGVQMQEVSLFKYNLNTVNDKQNLIQSQ